MIEIKYLNKYYIIGNEQYHALKDLNLTVGDGEMLAIKGRSGAGKTTLLNIIGGLDTFESGHVTVDGTELRNLSDDKLSAFRNNEIGYVLQDFSLINQKTVLFNVMLPMLFDKTPYSKIKKFALTALDSVGISDQVNKKAVQLSGGQRQRTAIARAIIKNTKILLADEPTGNLDTSTADDIMNLLSDLNRQGKTVIIVTHDDRVASYCKRVITISDGEITS
jgi:putative ABC transport system ATP-binding protein